MQVMTVHIFITNSSGSFQEDLKNHSGYFAESYNANVFPAFIFQQHIQHQSTIYYIFYKRMRLYFGAEYIYVGGIKMLKIHSCCKISLNNHD